MTPLSLSQSASGSNENSRGPLDFFILSLPSLGTVLVSADYPANSTPINASLQWGASKYIKVTMARRFRVGAATKSASDRYEEALDRAAGTPQHRGIQETWGVGTSTVAGRAKKWPVWPS